MKFFSGENVKLRIKNVESNRMKNEKFIEDREELERLAPTIKNPIEKQIFVCAGKSCQALGSADVKAAFEAALQKRGLRRGRESKGGNPNGKIALTDCGSVGLCKIGTAVPVYPDGVWYAQVRPEDAREIVERHIEKGAVVERLLVMTNGD